jgi:hypothetical protein
LDSRIFGIPTARPGSPAAVLAFSASSFFRDGHPGLASARLSSWLLVLVPHRGFLIWRAHRDLGGGVREKVGIFGRYRRRIILQGSLHGKLAWKGDLEGIRGSAVQILVDPSAGINYFIGAASPETDHLHALIGPSAGGGHRAGRGI